MESIHASLLLHTLGKEITEENLAKIIEAAGGKVDAAQLKTIVETLKSVNIEEVIASAGTVAPTVAPPAAAPAVEEEKPKKKEEKKKEEKKKEPEEEEEAGLASLFG
ncbi:MAG: 50S ribosomal protein P1 [Candidatus Hodarchaeota archaeon]